MSFIQKNDHQQQQAKDKISTQVQLTSSQTSVNQSIQDTTALVSSCLQFWVGICTVIARNFHGNLSVLSFKISRVC